MNNYKRSDPPIHLAHTVPEGANTSGRYMRLNGKQYRLGRPVGEGNHSSVFRIVSRSVNLPLVAKINGLDEDDLAQREGQTLRMINVPGVVRCFDHGTTDQGRTALVLEFVRGKTFSDTIGRTGTDRALKAVRRLADTLEKVHAQGVIHRDIKPANVMLTRDGMATILDFGIAARQGHYDDFFDRKASGTPRYMAPEQFSVGREHVNFGLDTYALGIIATEALTGTVPFSGRDINSMLYEKMCGIAARTAAQTISESPRTQNISNRGGIAEIVGRMLSPFPDDRPLMDEVNRVFNQNP